MKGFSVTFERWTHEAAEAGETDDRGFVIEGASLRDAIRDGLEFARPSWCGAFEADCSGDTGNVRWLTFYKWNDCTRENLETGIEEQRSIHIPDNVTAASRRRIVRLFSNR